ncbi:hypothetical protein JCM5296_000828 [Sporobolomyces johnsonii]
MTKRKGAGPHGKKNKGPAPAGKRKKAKVRPPLLSRSCARDVLPPPHVRSSVLILLSTSPLHQGDTKKAAKAIVDKAKSAVLPCSPSSSLAAVDPAPPPTSTASSYPQSFYNDDLSVMPLYTPAAARPIRPPRPQVMPLPDVPETDHRSPSSARSGSYTRRSDDYYEEDDGGYEPDYRSDLGGDEFYASDDEGGGIGGYDSDDSSSLSTGSLSPSSESSAVPALTSSAWADSPATSTSKVLYSPNSTASGNLKTAVRPPDPSSDARSLAQHQHEHYPLPGQISYHYAPPPLSSVYPVVPPTYVHPAQSASFPSSAAPTAPSPPPSPRGRNPHPRLLWRSVLSRSTIEALDAHHDRVAGGPLPRMSTTGAALTSSGVENERESAGSRSKAEAEGAPARVRNLKAVQQRRGRRPLSKEGKRWSKAVERCGL